MPSLPHPTTDHARAKGDLNAQGYYILGYCILAGLLGAGEVAAQEDAHGKTGDRRAARRHKIMISGKGMR